MTSQIKGTFSITIEGSTNSYLARVTGPGKIELKPRSFDLRLVDEHNDTLTLLATKPQKVSPEELVALGQALYQTLFVREVKTAFGQAQQRLRSGIRLRIQTSLPEIARLPWELMHDGERFIALRSSFPIVRATGDAGSSRRTDVRGPLRILYAWADPQDLPELNLEGTADQIRDLLR